MFSQLAHVGAKNTCLMTNWDYVLLENFFFFGQILRNNLICAVKSKSSKSMLQSPAGSWKDPSVQLFECLWRANQKKNACLSGQIHWSQFTDHMFLLFLNPGKAKEEFWAYKGHQFLKIRDIKLVFSPEYQRTTYCKIRVALD